MPSDPLPLSPETPATDAGNWLLGVPVPMFATRPALRQWSNDTLLPAVLAIEQEARTLARAEVIAEAVAAVEAQVPEPFDDPVMPLTTAYAQGYRDALRETIAALSRLGERE